LDLNYRDSGSREFIICTDNENNICSEICYPRIKKAIFGYKDLEGNKYNGLNGNMKYFVTSFVKRSFNQDQNKINITNKCTEMLCLKEGIFNISKEADDYRIFIQNNRIMAIYYSFLNDSLKELKKQLDKMKGNKILYCFTLDAFGLDKNNFIEWDDVVLEPIPQKILDIYEEIYEY
jgi:adenine-specific DNA-methyltransferase